MMSSFSFPRSSRDEEKWSDDGHISREVGALGESGTLRRELGYWDGYGVLVGIMIGSGIFASPGVALQRAGSPGCVLIVWVMAGLLVGVSSLSYMELTAMMPSAGGDFTFIKRAYGDTAAFSFAWYNFWVSKTGSQAIIATIFGQYVAWCLGTGELGDSSALATIAALFLIILLCVINCYGIRQSSNLQNLLTATKVGLIVFLFVAGMSYAINSSAQIEDNLRKDKAFVGSKGFGFFTSLVAALWAYDGWADLNFMAEELDNPTHNIPRVMGLGIGTVTIAYVLANIAYFSVLSIDKITDSDAIAIDFGYAVGGSAGRAGSALATLLALGVAFSTTGSANGSIMTGGRAFFAVARVGQAPRVFAKLNTKGSPYAALIAHQLMQGDPKLGQTIRPL